jgi:hypothetical protein
MAEQRGWTTEKLFQKAGWEGEYARQTADRLLHGSIMAGTELQDRSRHDTLTRVLLVRVFSQSDS